MKRFSRQNRAEAIPRLHLELVRERHEAEALREREGRVRVRVRMRPKNETPKRGRDDAVRWEHARWAGERWRGGEAAWVGRRGMQTARTRGEREARRERGDDRWADARWAGREVVWRGVARGRNTIPVGRAASITCRLWSTMQYETIQIFYYYSNIVLNTILLHYYTTILHYHFN